jgi:tellurite resistance protein
MPPDPTALRANLAHLPHALFAAPMWIGGLGLAWREAAQGLGAPRMIGEVLLLVAGVLWVLIVALHGARLLRHPAALAADLEHPVRLAFAGAVTIGVMIIAGGLAPHARDLASVLWLVAVAGHVAVAGWTLRGLLVAPREAATPTPPLLMPQVGNILAPILGVGLGHPVLSWMMFGIGALLWLMLQLPLLGRLISGTVLPPRLRPTLAILLAPPAAGAVALAALTGGFGPGPLGLSGLAVLLAWCWPAWPLISLACPSPCRGGAGRSRRRCSQQQRRARRGAGGAGRLAVSGAVDCAAGRQPDRGDRCRRDAARGAGRPPAAAGGVSRSFRPQVARGRSVNRAKPSGGRSGVGGAHWRVRNWCRRWPARPRPRR